LYCCLECTVSKCSYVLMCVSMCGFLSACVCWILQSGFRSPYSVTTASELASFSNNFQSVYDVAYADTNQALFSYVRRSAAHLFSADQVSPFACLRHALAPAAISTECLVIVHSEHGGQGSAWRRVLHARHWVLVAQMRACVTERAHSVGRRRLWHHTCCCTVPIR
jgi:hypothetical protein